VLVVAVSSKGTLVYSLLYLCAKWMAPQCSHHQRSLYFAIYYFAWVQCPHKITTCSFYHGISHPPALNGVCIPFNLPNVKQRASVAYSRLQYRASDGRNQTIIRAKRRFASNEPDIICSSRNVSFTVLTIAGAWCRVGA
jgi:hypothetical protein